MKVFTFVLASCICFLLAQPTLSVIGSLLKTEQCAEEHCEKKCPEAQKRSDKQTPGDCCPNGICNPYCPCCTFLSSEKIILPDKRTSEENKFLPVTEKITSGYFSDCFRPPEIG